MANTNSPLMPHERKKELELKKKHACVVSIFGNIDAHFPAIREKVEAALKEHHPEEFIHAVQKGVIKGTHSFPTGIPGARSIAVDMRPLTVGREVSIPGRSQ